LADVVTTPANHSDDTKEDEMALADLLQQDAIIPALKVNSKKQLLQELSAKASRITGVPEREVFDVILQRERLGSTGVGHGIAIPHGKLESISSIVGVFARLESPVDFEALDDQPVDLVFLLLAPEGAGADHLKALSRIARVLRDQELVAKLRATDSDTAIYAFLNAEQANAA
jgi:PTS system nitrogen regulatory IIA component